jgi:membrane-bound metal-dependent hydrolase YbcI (DUF457 family)
MIFGHLTVTAAGHRLLKRRLWPACPVPLGPLLVGAYLPDLLDKPLAMATGLAGRGYGHSVLVQAVLFALAWVALRRHRTLLVPLALGSLLHLLQDWVTLEVLLAPLLGAVPDQPMEPLWQKLARFYTSGSPQMWLEVAAIAYWLVVGAGMAAGRAARRRSHQRMPSSSAL